MVLVKLDGCTEKNAKRALSITSHKTAADGLKTRYLETDRRKWRIALNSLAQEETF